MTDPNVPATPEVPPEGLVTTPENPGLRDDRDPYPAPAGPAVSDGVTDPNQLASGGPEGSPQPVPREEDPGINANVVS